MFRLTRGRSHRLVFGGLVAFITVIGLVLLGPSFGSAKTVVAPVNVTEPQISGLAVVGQMLQATTGSWSKGPTRFAFEWRRCPSNGGAGDASNCATIFGATSGGYVPVAADVGSTIRVRVTASNASGNATAASNATAVVAGAGAPFNTSPL